MYYIEYLWLPVEKTKDRIWKSILMYSCHQQDIHLSEKYYFLPSDHIGDLHFRGYALGNALVI